jgi:isopenicillin N synthase-like dioxygenase
MLSQTCKAFASVVYAGVTGADPKQASDTISSLVDEDDWPFSGSYHRLCQYIKIEEVNRAESLRSHADWTVSTAIPVSTIAGLEIFNPRTERWVHPELVARNNWETNHPNPIDQNEDALPWNTRYAVVFAGTWLELLTNGRFESTIHRVMTSSDAALSRTSAPFFMRPTERVFARVEECFDDRLQPSDMGATEAMEAISKFLLQKQFR